MSNQTKHTPGPWEAGKTAGSETHGQWAVYGGDGKDVAIVYDGDSDAHLIAAAPEHHEQAIANVEAMKEWLDYDLPSQLREHIQGRIICTQAAIAKAEGRQ